MHHSELTFNLFGMRRACDRGGGRDNVHVIYKTFCTTRNDRDLRDSQRDFPCREKRKIMTDTWVRDCPCCPPRPMLVSGTAGLNPHEAAPCDATYQTRTSDSLTVCVVKLICIGCHTDHSVLCVWSLQSRGLTKIDTFIWVNSGLELSRVHPQHICRILVKLSCG